MLRRNSCKQTVSGSTREFLACNWCELKRHNAEVCQWQNPLRLCWFWTFRPKQLQIRWIKISCCSGQRATASARNKHPKYRTGTLFTAIGAGSQCQILANHANSRYINSMQLGKTCLGATLNRMLHPEPQNLASTNAWNHAKSQLERRLHLYLGDLLPCNSAPLGNLAVHKIGKPTLITKIALWRANHHIASMCEGHQNADVIMPTHQHDAICIVFWIFWEHTDLLALVAGLPEDTLCGSRKQKTIKK